MRIPLGAAWTILIAAGALTACSADETKGSLLATATSNQVQWKPLMVS